MSHSEYFCCAICDCKMEFDSWNAVPKESICIDCLLALQRLGLPIATTAELCDYVGTLNKRELGAFIKRIGYSFCCFENSVDNVVGEMLGGLEYEKYRLGIGDENDAARTVGKKVKGSK